MGDALDNCILPTSPACAERLQHLIDKWRTEHPEETNGDGCLVEHLFHAGCYCRTMFCPKDSIFISVQVKRPTILIVSGDATFSDTEKAFRITGYKVLLGASMRQSIVRTHEDTYFTAIFATNAKTVKEAEQEAVTRPDQLLELKELHNEFCGSSHCGGSRNGNGGQHVSGEAPERPSEGG